MTARQEWITVQKRLVEELKDSLYDTVTRQDSVLDEYYRDYQQEFKDGYERVASRDEIVQRMMRASIAYFGDFHSLRSAQTSVLDLLEAVVERDRRVILCVEMLHTRDQHHTDEYLQGDTDDEQFKWRVRWEKTWGFSWSSWRRFLEFGTRHNLPVFGVNADIHTERALHERDDYAARLIATLTRLYPRHLIAVVYGDLHIAASHLPSAVDRVLKTVKEKRRHLRVYQNSETLYWKLVEEHRDAVVDFLKIRNDVYALMNATPLVKFQSFANWQYQRTTDLNFDSDEIDLLHEQNLLEQVHGYIKTIAGFLGVELEDSANFVIYTAADIDLLENLVRRNIYTAQEMKALKDYVEMAESAFFERARVLYLGRFTVSDAAEAAGRYILSELRPSSSDAVENRDEFYARCMVEALAFFCSKIIDPRRTPRTAADWQAVLDHHGRRRKLSRIDKLDVQTAKSFLRHKQYEQRVLESGHMNGAPRSLFELATDQHVALTRALGRVLGHRLYAGLSRELVDRELVRDVMQDPIRTPGLSRRRYFELLEQLSGLADADANPKRKPRLRRDFDADDE